MGDLDAQNSTAKEINLSWVNYLKRVAVKGFPQITTAPDARVGYQALMQCGGLGGMRINSVVLPLPPVTVQDAERQTDASGPEFYNVRFTTAVRPVGMLLDFAPCPRRLCCPAVLPWSGGIPT